MRVSRGVFAVIIGGWALATAFFTTNRASSCAGGGCFACGVCFNNPPTGVEKVSEERRIG